MREQGKGKGVWDPPPAIAPPPGIQPMPEEWGWESPPTAPWRRKLAAATPVPGRGKGAAHRYWNYQ